MARTATPLQPQPYQNQKTALLIITPNKQQHTQYYTQQQQQSYETATRRNISQLKGKYIQEGRRNRLINYYPASHQTQYTTQPTPQRVLCTVLPAPHAHQKEQL